ncbi:MAG: two-component regulator propeller domain-containing protein [Bacteroidota bacterium]
MAIAHYLIVSWYLLLFLLCGGPNLFAQGRASEPILRFEHYSTEEGLTSNSVTAILQDSRGFVWIGTPKGLNRYDGAQIKQLAMDSSGNSGELFIRSIEEGQGGNLWVGTARNGLLKYNWRKNQLSHSSPLLETEDWDILSLWENTDQSLWIGTNKGLFLARPGDTPPEQVLLGKGKQPSVTCILPGAQTDLWIGTEEKGLFRIKKDYSDKNFQQYTKESSVHLPDNRIRTLLLTKDNVLVIGTNEGIGAFQEGNPGRDDFAFSRAFPQLMNADIEALTEDRAGRIWVGTFDKGLFRLDLRKGELAKVAAQSGGLEDSVIISLLTDRSGLLWVGTYSRGAYTTNPVKVEFNFVSPGDNSSNGDVYAIFEESDEDIWMGTSQGLTRLNPYLQSFQKLSHPEWEQTIMYAIQADDQGGIFLGSSGQGLGYLKKQELGNGKIDVLGLIGEDILCIYKDPLLAGTYWVGHTSGMARITMQPGGLPSLELLPSLEETFAGLEVQTILRDRNGKLWIGTYTGIFVWPQDSDTPQRFSGPENQFDELTVYALHQGADSSLWIGTNKGLWWYAETSGEVGHYTIFEGLPDNFVYSILPDKEGNFWISSNLGLTKARIQGTPQTLMFISYDLKSGLQCRAFNYGAFHRGTSGNMYMGCDRGLTYFHPDLIVENDVPPLVSILDFQIADTSVSPGNKAPFKGDISATKEIVLEYDQNDITFEFIALNYIEPEKNEYAYLMEGVNNSWRYVKQNRTAVFNDLAPGNYVFRVKAAYNSGIWNEQGTSLRIIVNPPFWQTPLFYLFELLIAGLLVLLFVKIRTRQLEQNKRKLEEKIAQRTQELSRQKERTEEALEDLKATQTQLVESEKMASLGQLTAGVAHEINNPITFVNGNVRPLKRDLDDLLSILNAYESAAGTLSKPEVFAEVTRLKSDLEYGLLVEEIHQLLDGIEEGAQRTSKIVKGLQNFSRLDEQDRKLADIHEGLNSTCLILSNELKGDIEVIKDYGDIPKIMCYPGKLNQVFMNLLTNAIQAIEGKGAITLKTRLEGGEVKISIEDTGKGMDEAIQKRIFEPFFTTKDVGYGTGLGLSISFGIIEHHNGKITVSSEIGKGSVFCISLPAETGQS